MYETVNIFNLTPHPIQVKNDLTGEVVTIPTHQTPEGLYVIARRSVTTQPFETVNGFQISETVYGNCEIGFYEKPNDKEPVKVVQPSSFAYSKWANDYDEQGNLFITSALFMGGLSYTEKWLNGNGYVGVGRLVRDADGNISHAEGFSL